MHLAMAFMATFDILIGGIFGGIFDWQGVVLLGSVLIVWRQVDQHREVVTINSSFLGLCRDFFLVGLVIASVAKHFGIKYQSG